MPSSPIERKLIAIMSTDIVDIRGAATFLNFAADVDIQLFI